MTWGPIAGPVFLSLAIYPQFVGVLKMSHVGVHVSAPQERPLPYLEGELMRSVEQNFWIKIKGYVKLDLSKLCKHAWSQK